MNINELLITGYDGGTSLFAVTLTADEARVVKLGAGERGEDVVGEAWRKATYSFADIRDLMDDIVGSPETGDRAEVHTLLSRMDVCGTRTGRNEEDKA